MVGSNTIHLFRVQDIDMEIKQASSSLLSPLPVAMVVKSNGEEVYSFRPSLGGNRLKSFVDIVKAAALENDPLEFSDRGGLLYEEGEGKNGDD